MAKTKKPQIQWTAEKIQLLRDEYPMGDKEKLANALGISRKTLKDAAKRFKVKSLIDRRLYRAIELLNDSPESYYWHGFIMADGHIGERNRLKLTLSSKDEIHLEKFRSFLKTSISITRQSIKTSYNNNNVYSTLSISDVHTCNELKNKYNWKNTKTINPPTIDCLFTSKENFMSFFIGFFDGDGCFDKRPSGVCGMKIECHPNWMPILEQLACGLQKYLGITAKVNFTSRNYSCLRFYKYEYFILLKQFIIAEKLPIMDRKWDLIDINKIRKKNKK